MKHVRALRFPIVASLLLAVAALGGAFQSAEAAYPPAGTDQLPVVVTADSVSRLGKETVVFTGWIEVDREAPHMEGGTEVVDMEIVDMELVGAASIGAVTVAERQNSGQNFISIGEFREVSPGNDFPASSFFDVFVDVTVPADPSPTLTLHNNLALHVTPTSNITAWPPLGATYELDPIFQFDNDGDTQVDEDPSDDDNDGFFDEDPINGANDDASNGLDTQTDEDPPITQCTGAPFSPVCDDDSDGEDDEDPGCVPMFGESGSSMPHGFCLRDLTMQIAPETPSFSVARGGPSGLHPASILALTPGEVTTPPPPPPTIVTGNDPFASAWNIAANPFIGQQTTTIFTTELAQCGNSTDDDGDTIANDGCATVSAPESNQCAGSADNDGDLAPNDGCPAVGGAEVSCAEAIDSDGDTWVNDGCPTVPPTAEFNQCTNALDDDADGRTNDGCPSVGPAEQAEPNALSCTGGAGTSKSAWYNFTPGSSGPITIDTIGSNFDTVLSAYTGSALPALTQVACDDDGAGGSGPSIVTFSVNSGTTYRIRVASWSSSAGGNLVLNLNPGAVSSGSDAPFVRISCTNLGLTADGCDNGADGDIDDVDALSFGNDLGAGLPGGINFSVGPGSTGMPNTAVRAQTQCPSAEPEPDEFFTVLQQDNSLVLDGNGPIGSCTSAFPLGLLEGPASRDNLDALDRLDPLAVDANSNGIPEAPVYFSLDEDSPSLNGITQGDILKTVNGAAPTVYASMAALGLEAGDDIDAVCLKENGNGTYSAVDDQVLFSLAFGSTTLAQIGAQPADILSPNPANPTIMFNQDRLGLDAADDVDAMKCGTLKDDAGDTDGDTVPNGTDTDDDNDGCTDVQENGNDEVQGGLRDPHNFWDLFDVWTGGGPSKDYSVASSDIFQVISRFNTSGNPSGNPMIPAPPTGYHTSYDRSQSIGPHSWNLGPANGSIASTDIFAVIGQFGHAC